MGKIIVLGIGNLLMMDDGIGVRLARVLARREKKSNIQYVIGEMDIDYSLERIRDARFVIVLDAVCLGKEPGEISVIPFACMSAQQTLPISPHTLHLFEMLHLQKVVKEGYIIGVEPCEIRFYHGLSKVLKGKWHRLLRDVAETIDELLAMAGYKDGNSGCGFVDQVERNDFQALKLL